LYIYRFQQADPRLPKQRLWITKCDQGFFSSGRRVISDGARVSILDHARTRGAI
jgi:hypothetical protein